MVKYYKLIRNFLGIICGTFIAVICVLAAKSDLYQIDSPYRGDNHIDPNSWEILTDEESTKDGKFVIQRTFTQEDFGQYTAHPSIVFGSVNTKIRVFVNDEQCYSFGNNGKRLVGYESGDSGHFIRLPEKHMEEFVLRIEYAPFEEGASVPHEMPNLVIGAMADLIHGFKMDEFAPGAMSFAILAIGLMGLFFTSAFWISLKKFPLEYFSWSLFASLCGIGFLFDSHYIDLFIANSFLLYFVPTVILAAMPIVFHIYIFSNKTLACNRNVMLFFSFISAGIIILDCIAAAFPVLPFSIAKFITNVLVIVFLFFIIAVQISECITYKGSLSIPIILLFVSAFSVIVDLGMNIIPPENEQVFFLSTPVFLVYFIVQTVYVINDFFNVQVLSARKEMYEDTVNKDGLTGVRARQMFWRYRNFWSKKAPNEKEQTVLVLAEVSNIRFINENFSFERGDEAIKLLASTLQQNFSAGNVYRFDLAGFAIINEGITLDIIERKINDIMDFFAEYNKSIPSPLRIRFSYAKYDDEKDDTFDAFVTRAEMLLCEEKLK